MKGTKTIEFKKDKMYLFEFNHSAFGGGIREIKCNGVLEEENLIKMDKVWWDKDQFLESRTIRGEI